MCLHFNLVKLCAWTELSISLCACPGGSALLHTQDFWQLWVMRRTKVQVLIPKSAGSDTPNPLGTGIFCSVAAVGFAQSFSLILELPHLLS